MNINEKEIKQKIKSYTREELENKFFNLFAQNFNVFDVNDFKKVRRLQYLNKTYTKNVEHYNFLIREYKENNNNIIGLFLQNLYETLEAKAIQNQDFKKV